MLWWLAQNTVTAALLAGVVSALCRWGRFRPAVSHALWLIVLLKLLTPPVVVWPWSLPDLFAQPSPDYALPVAPAERLTVSVPEETIVRRVQMGPALQALANDNALAVDALEQVRVAEPEPAISWRAAWVAPMLLYAWLAGAACTALLQASRILRYRRLLARGKRAPRCLAKQVDDHARPHPPPRPPCGIARP